MAVEIVCLSFKVVMNQCLFGLLWIYSTSLRIFYMVSPFVVFHCGVLLILSDFAHILQGYFTGTGAILWQDCPSASEATLKDMGKWITWLHKELLCHHNNINHKKTGCIFIGYTVDVHCSDFEADVCHSNTVYILVLTLQKEEIW